MSELCKHGRLRCFGTAAAESAELIETIEAAFDEVSLSVEGTVIAAGLFPMPS
jgi:hypothetical protein